METAEDGGETEGAVRRKKKRGAVDILRPAQASRASGRKGWQLHTAFQMKINTFVVEI